MSIFDFLCDANNYYYILKERFSQFKDDLNFVNYFYPLVGDNKMVHKIISEIEAKTYKLSPVRETYIVQNGKKRTTHYIKPQDRMVMAVLQRAIRSLVDPQDMNHIFDNYIGRSPMGAVRLLSNYIKDKHKGAKLDLYIVRSDWRKFFDAIPVHNKSAIWKELKKLCDRDPSQKNMDYIWTLIKDAVNPLVEAENGSKKHKTIGVPTGSPICAVLANIYPSPIDKLLSNIPGSFYIRFVDDFIFAHEDPEILLSTYETVKEYTKELELTIHPDKERLVYLTTCGRPSSNYPQFKGSSHIDFLGCYVNGKGAIRAIKKNRNRFMVNIKRRLEKTRKECEHLEFEEKLACLMNTLNTLLDPDNPLAEEKLQPYLRKTSDRRELKALDRELMLTVIQKALNKRGRRVLRQFSYRNLLDKHPITLLERKRNLFVEKKQDDFF